MRKNDAMNLDLFSTVFLVALVLSVAAPVLGRWKLRRDVRESLGLERIRRKSDLVERELRFDVLDRLRYGDGSKVVRVEFSFYLGAPGMDGNGWISLEPVEIHTGSDAHNRAIESQLVEQIKKARARYSETGGQ